MVLACDGRGLDIRLDSESQEEFSQLILRCLLGRGSRLVGPDYRTGNLKV